MAAWVINRPVDSSGDGCGNLITVLDSGFGCLHSLTREVGWVAMLVATGVLLVITAARVGSLVRDGWQHRLLRSFIAGLLVLACAIIGARVGRHRAGAPELRPYWRALLPALIIPPLLVFGVTAFRLARSAFGSYAIALTVGVAEGVTLYGFVHHFISTFG
jgi:hypothetical protein